MLCDKLARPDLELTARHSAASTPPFWREAADTGDCGTAVSW